MDELKFNVLIPPMEFRELSKTGNPKLDKELDRGNRSVKKDSQENENQNHIVQFISCGSTFFVCVWNWKK